MSFTTEGWSADPDPVDPGGNAADAVKDQSDKQKPPDPEQRAEQKKQTEEQQKQREAQQKQRENDFDEDTQKLLASIDELVGEEPSKPHLGTPDIPENREQQGNSKSQANSQRLVCHESPVSRESPDSPEPQPSTSRAAYEAYEHALSLATVEPEACKYGDISNAAPAKLSFKDFLLYNLCYFREPKKIPVKTDSDNGYDDNSEDLHYVKIFQEWETFFQDEHERDKQSKHSPEDSLYSTVIEDANLGPAYGGYPSLPLSTELVEPRNGGMSVQSEEDERNGNINIKEGQPDAGIQKQSANNENVNIKEGQPDAGIQKQSANNENVNIKEGQPDAGIQKQSANNENVNIKEGQPDAGIQKQSANNENVNIKEGQPDAGIQKQSANNENVNIKEGQPDAGIQKQSANNENVNIKLAQRDAGIPGQSEKQKDDNVNIKNDKPILAGPNKSEKINNSLVVDEEKKNVKLENSKKETVPVFQNLLKRRAMDFFYIRSPSSSPTIDSQPESQATTPEKRIRCETNVGNSNVINVSAGNNAAQNNRVDGNNVAIGNVQNANAERTNEPVHNAARNNRAGTNTRPRRRWYGNRRYQNNLYYNPFDYYWPHKPS